jgi:uncharacterized protein YjiS (DUF1127 family)
MSSPSAPFLSLLQVLSRLVKAIENRRAAKALMHMDARGLSDIGLTRGAVDGAFANTSAFEDPTPLLSRIALRRGSEPAARESAPSPPEADKDWSGHLPSSMPAALA